MHAMPAIPLAPHRLSGVVYGVLFNHTPALAALGEQVNRAPYQGAPKAPVLYLKPRNTLVGDGAEVSVPAEAPELEVGAALGVVIGRPSCKLTLTNALDHVAGYTVVNDVSVPHDSYYRPSVRFKARDGFCPIGPDVVPRHRVQHPDALRVRVMVDGVLRQETTTGERIRGLAQLLVDVTDFMTLQPGDVLMTGVAAGAPRAKAGQEVMIDIEGVGCLRNRFVAESVIPGDHA